MAENTYSEEAIFRIVMRSGKPFVMAGLWGTWKDSQVSVVSSYTIITTSANDYLAPIYNRMAIILPRRSEEELLDSGIKNAASITGLFNPYPDEDLGTYEVSTLANNEHNEELEVIARMG